VYTFFGDLARRDQAITIQIGKGKCKQYKDVPFKGWLSKGQMYFLQSKNICRKNCKDKKGPV
jgi:hypothetical protein